MHNKCIVYARYAKNMHKICTKMLNMQKKNASYAKNMQEICNKNA